MYILHCELPIIFQYAHSCINQQCISKRQQKALGKTLYDSCSSTQINSTGDQKAEECGITFCKVLACKDCHCPVKNEYIINTAFLCTLPFIMNDPCSREIVIVVACFCNTVTQINVFTIHEIIFIKQSRFIKSFLSYH